MNDSTPSEPTFDRLLQVAVEVFAELGFRDATVREICSRANVNVASVNYYFRSKEALYRQALTFAFQQANRLYPQDAAADGNLPPERRLVAFVNNFLNRLLDDSQLGLVSKMITREIADPTPAFDGIIETMIAPQCLLLKDIVGSLIGCDDHEVVDRCVLGILGQCLMFKHSRSVIDRLYPHLLVSPVAIQANAEHIVRFSLAGLQTFRQPVGGASA